MTYIELPNTPGTPETRLSALKEARELLKGEPKTTGAAMFSGAVTSPGEVADSTELIRLASYIDTGHDYADTHPVGKRRPIIHEQNVTVHAIGMPGDVLRQFTESSQFDQMMHDLLHDAEHEHEHEHEKEPEQEPDSK